MKLLIKKIAQRFGYDILHLPISSLDRQKKDLFNEYGINLIFDVGANTGQFAERIRNEGYKGRIVSFEPLQEEFAQLNFKTQNETNWQAVNCAIGNFDGEVTINVSKNSYSSSILPILENHIDSAPEAVYVDKAYTQIKKIDSIIDKYYEQQSRLFVKIDTQGFEKQVFEGCKKSLSKISGFQMELSLIPLYEGETLMQEMITLLREYGYRLMLLEGGYRHYNTKELVQVECFFFYSN